MDLLIANLQENAILYGCLAACAIPLIYLTRKYSLPVILYTVEFIIYACVMHVVLHVLVKLTRWFKEQSSMKMLREDGKPIDAPEWSTPLLDFWHTEFYDPTWLWKVELGCLFLILLLIWHYRPMKIQRKSGRKTQEYAGRGAKGKPGALAKKGSYKPTRGARGTRGR